MPEEEAEEAGGITRPPTPPEAVVAVAVAVVEGGGGGGAGEEEVCGWVQDTEQNPPMSMIWCTERTHRIGTDFAGCIRMGIQYTCKIKSKSRNIE